jgi:general stress protein 26
MMLGLAGSDDGLSQPMTALLENGHERGPIWTFTAKDTDLASEVQAAPQRAVAQFASKGHSLFASIEGRLVADNDRAMVDKLWSPFVAAWFKGGKDDPNLQLLRFEPERAQIWLNDHSLLAGVKLLLGRDPKDSYRDKTADVRL